MRPLARAIVSLKLPALALSLLLTGCGGGGGGGGGDEAPAPAPTGGQAVLGPLAGAEINAYLLSDLDTPIEGPIRANDSRTDLQAAGRFKLLLTDLPDETWVLVTATGGADIDVDDDGRIDAEPKISQGTVHALARAADWRAGVAHITALSEIGWLYVQDVLNDETAVTARLDRMAHALLTQDLNDDGHLDSRDLAFFRPGPHQQYTLIDYRALLPDADPTHDTLIEQLHAGGNFDLAERTTWVESQWGEQPWNRLPQANAGIDQAVDEQSEVTLTGTASDSDGTIVSYDWTQVSGPSVTLSNTSGASVTFTTPVLTEVAKLEFQLTVTDNEGGTATDTVVVTVNPVNANPTVDAGVKQSVNEQTDVTLAGAASDSDGSIVSYAWSQTSGPTAALATPNNASTTLTTPVLTEMAELTFALQVTDNEGGTATDTLTVTVLPVNASPSVNAGEDQSVNELAAVTLEGSASDSDGSIASYSWRQLSGDAVQLSGASSASASFTAPATAVQTSLSFELQVTDNEGASATDVVDVTVSDTNGRFQIATATPVVDEGVGSVLVTVSRIGGSSGEVSVNYATQEWTATAGSDYEHTSGALVWADGDSADNSFSVPILDDDTYFEGREQLTVELSAAQTATIADGSLTLSIDDNDIDTTPPTAQFAIPPGEIAMLRLVDMTVSGRAGDDVELASVRVNGSDVTSTDGFATWTADLSSLGWGEHTLSLEVIDRAGNTTTLSDVRVKAGIGSDSLYVVAYNPYNDQLLLHSSDKDLYTMDVASGYVTPAMNSNSIYPARAIPEPGSEAVYILSYTSVERWDIGAGTKTIITTEKDGLLPGFETARGLAVDFDQGVGYVLDSNGIISFDLASGQRTMLSASTSDMGPWPHSRKLLLRTNGKLMMAADRSLIEVDRVTGYRTEVLQASESLRSIAEDTATGTVYLGTRCTQASIYRYDEAAGTLVTAFSVDNGCPTELVYDSRRHRLLASWSGEPELVAIDLAADAWSRLDTEWVGGGPAVPVYADLVYRAGESAFYATDARSYAVLRIDKQTGDRVEVSSALAGSGPALTKPWDLAYNQVDGLLYVADHDQLLSVDPADGSRQVISSAMAPVGDPIDSYRSVALDSVGQRAFIASSTAIYEVDLTTAGARVIASAEVGTGTEWGEPPSFVYNDAADLAYDPESGQLYFNMNPGNDLFSLNPESLERTVFSTDSMWPQNIEVDSVRGSLLVSDYHADSVWVFELASGQLLEKRELSVVNGMNGLTYDADSRTAFFFNDYNQGLWAVDMSTGTEAIIAK